MRRAFAAVCFAILLLFVFAGFAVAESLIPNGGFEVVSASNLPENWYTTAYHSQPGYSRMTITDEKAYSGKYSAMVENASANDARFITAVKVEPESLYRLSGYVCVEHMEDTGNGANFAVEGIYSFSDTLFTTDGKWQYLEWYGETGEDQTEVTIGLRVGGYSAESTGKAYFDDIKLEKVKSLPSNVIASLWYNAYIPVEPESATSESDEKSTILFVAFAIAFLLLTAVVSSGLHHKPSARQELLFAALMCIALVVRVVLGMRVEGYEVDINCFKAWSLRIASVGPVNFYAPDYFCDYPPGAVLLLWPVGVLLQLAGFQNASVSLLIIKLLPVVCDLLGAFCLYCYRSKHCTFKTPAACAALYLFNPAALVNGACWGQMDSVLALLVLFTSIAAMKRCWKTAIPLFTVSVLVKPQTLLFAPVGGLAFLFHAVSSEKEARKKVLKEAMYGVLIAIACALIIVIPFAVGQENPVRWLFELYGGTLGSYAYATLNTANLYYLFGANWVGLTQKAPVLLLVLTAAAFAAAGVYVRMKTQAPRGADWLLLGMSGSTLLLLVFGADYNCFGYAMMAFVYLLTIVCLNKNRNFEHLAYFLALALIGVYVFGIKMHERYLFPALLLLLTAFCATRDKRILGVFAGFSVTTFINTAIILDNSILYGASQGHLNQDTQALNLLLCVLNILLCVYAFWIGISGLSASKEIPKKTSSVPVQEMEACSSSYAQSVLTPRDHRLKLTWRDWSVMGVTTILYAVLAFSNLGSLVAPQTAWVSTSKDESIILELDETETFSVLYYGGISYRDFAIAVSDDGVTWSQTYPCEMREGLCYRWNYALNTTTSDGVTTYPTAKPSNVLWLTGKFLKIDACEAGLNLWEIVARNKAGENLPLRIAEHLSAQPQLLAENKPASNLIDEQNTCVGEPGWFNSMYFDEIYHARTAYEHLHGQAPYETTHPPLGKLLMAVGIAIFGMTPFGWRFAGALIGVLMLPAIYLLAMQLTHKRKIAVVSMLAFALDLMHFTQTRLATIDSFPVFFIILTYFFMVRYMQMDAFAVSDPRSLKLLDRAYLKTLLPLFFCGICMGLSIASKWIGIYSAVGLAVLFFLTVYRHGRAWDAAWTLQDDTNCRVQSARQFTLHRIGITCGCCVVFFVLIPCLIYCLSYIPYLSPTGPVTLRRIISAQEGMLSYHSTPGLGMDHPFQSPWWQWPLLLKPMWFAQDQFEPAGYASTILCFGNPWIFYIGAVAMVSVLICWVMRYIQLCDGKLVTREGNGDLIYVILSIAFLAQYLPWVLVPRSMYMYHYFASVPFIILSTAVLMDKVDQEKPALGKMVTALYLLGAVIFFVMFFPYASGYLTSTRWLDAMKWFSKLYY